MGEPSSWLRRWPLRAGATALDLACGSGRNLRHLVALGMRVTGVDRDEAAIAPLRAIAGKAEIIHADIENGPWPLHGRQFDLVVVCNYLWRPLFPAIEAAVAPGGWLVYETFALGQHTIGRPSRPEFLLKPGELLSAFPGLRIVAFEDGYASNLDPAVNGRYVQRVAAVREQNKEEYPRHILE